MSVSDSSIEWTDATWGPIRGCSRVSAGCENCYAERQANRFKGKGLPYEGLVRLSKKGPVWTGKVRLFVDQLDVPLRWRKPKRVFVNSMSDLFHERVTDDEIAAIFGVMAACPQHSFQILTKRAKRMRAWFEWIERAAMDDIDLATRASDPRGYGIARFLERVARETLERGARPLLFGTVQGWPLRNVWLGVSVEDQERANERIPELLRVPASVRFVSYEPALGPVDFAPFLPPKVGTCGANCEHSLAHDRAALSWLIVGGESGPGARPFDIAWAASTIRQCKDAGVPCFVKQLGRDPYEDFVPSENPYGRTVRSIHLKDTKGGTMREWPKELRVREYPKVARP